jgi:hypothetical protein
MILASFILVLGILWLAMSSLTLFNGLSSAKAFTWNYKHWIYSWFTIGASAQYIWG